MPRKGDKKPPAIVGNPADPQGMSVMMDGFVEWMRVRNYSERTLDSRQRYLVFFIEWAEDRGITRPGEVTKPVLERYQRYVYHLRKRDGQPLAFRSQHSRLVPLRAWFKWLARNNHILYNPASELELPRLQSRLPKHVLTIREAETVLAVPNTSEPLGLRDRAILETLYSTGMRRLELIGLKLYDLDSERGTVMIREGKGKKDRMVPIGARALRWTERYLRDVRPRLLLDPNDLTVFLSHLGEAFTCNRLSQLVKGYVDGADIGKRGSCHLFRHTMATLMHENGAEIRFIQAMLGHANLKTTQIYTHVSIRKLKEIHDATHPAKLERDKRSEDGEETAQTESKADVDSESDGPQANPDDSSGPRDGEAGPSSGDT